MIQVHRVARMDEFDMQNTPAGNPGSPLESLCQEFNGISFYGLEYIIEDFFQANNYKVRESSFTPLCRLVRFVRLTEILPNTYPNSLARCFQPNFVVLRSADSALATVRPILRRDFKLRVFPWCVGEAFA